MEKYDDALRYYQQAIEQFRAANDSENVSVNYIAIGNVYRKRGDFEKARSNHLMALQIGREMNNAFCMGQAYKNLAETIRMQGDLDSALKNYFAAEEMFHAASNKLQQASICIEIGKIYLRLNKLTKAKEYLNKTFYISGGSASKLFLLDYYNGIQSLDSARSNWQDAYFNFRQYINYRDSVYNEANTKSTMHTVMQYEFDKKEAATKAEQEKKDIQQRNIRNSILVGLGGSLIFLIVLYRQRNKVSKARKRSDELLLNILPTEVADELKEKGSADAKHFDEVTVMFTDFKGFTQISERLSPTELVNEIHSCFKAFDNIISNHNIEKIKTIGDAYMCAGGLPVTNTSHAEDVVLAALEIQQFMEQHLSERKNSGKETFEIRIGIHTGPVVAVIVEIKKYSYDIWGDTVNIASRMESSGEAGKVNISTTTYEQVKNKFHCTYRGKISAKNNGEIDMYFVEQAANESAV